MLMKCVTLLLLAQCLLAAPPTRDDASQKQLEAQARNETVNLLNSLFRAQIAYFSGVRVKLNQQTKRARDIELYVSRLNEAIKENDLDKKDAMWLNIFDEFSKSPLLLNKESDTGLSDKEYKDLLTDDKLQAITKSFVTDVTTYFFKMAKFSGQVVGKAFEDYMEREKTNNALSKQE